MVNDNARENNEQLTNLDNFPKIDDFEKPLYRKLIIIKYKNYDN